MLGENRFDYPVNHIEADNRLCWLLGRLDKIYGNDAFYVHLKRKELDTAKSFVKRYSGGIIKAYRGDGILMGLPEESDPMAVSLDYCDTINSNIQLFLKDKTSKLEVNLENIEQDFTTFWKVIGAQGELSAGLAEFETVYNPSKPPQLKKKKKIIPRIFLKLKRLIVSLPEYIKNT